jgi:hypothetical protein
MSVEAQSSIMTFVKCVWALSAGRSLLLMFGSHKLFKKAKKNPNNAFIPVLNLFSALEIAEVSPYWGILFFVPIANIIPLLLMSYKLGTVFKMNSGIVMGMVLCPPLFYPTLYNSKKTYKIQDEEYFKALNNAKGERSLIQPDNPTPPVPEKPKVDSIFKGRISEVEQGETYHATRMNQEDLAEIDKVSNSTTYDPLAPIDKAPIPPKPEDLQNQPVQPVEEKKNVEFIDL